MNCLLCDSSNVLSKSFSSSKIHICSNCSLQFLDSEESDKEYFKDFFKKLRQNDTHLNQLREIQYQIDSDHLQKIVSDGKILDVGCSTGELLSKLTHKDYQLFGIDLDESAIPLAQKNFGNQIQFENTDLIHYNTDLKFDCIVFRGTFQYLGKDLKLTLQKLLKISSKDAKIIIYSLPNSDSFIYYILKDKWHLFKKFEHKLIFNRKSIQKLCELYKFRLVELSYPYLETPYAQPKRDYESLIELIKGDKIHSFPFWGNMMQIVMEKMK